jgi:acyl-CoA thioester hydrolase
VNASIEIRVRYSEVDQMGVVHHTVYPVWFEMGRTEMLRSTGRTYKEFEEAGILLAVVRLEISYKSPARYDDLVRVETTLTRVTSVKLEHSYRVLRDDDVLVTGTTTLACLDRNGRACALPQGLLTHPAASPLVS